MGFTLPVYAGLLYYYQKKWHNDAIDQKYQNWEEDQKMRKDMGYDEESFRRIPKRKIRNRAARKKHGY